MEDAQITQDQEDQPMYQAPEYPSMVDTDDIIYEMGKQVVDNLNKEKLIKMAAHKIQMIEGGLTERNTAIENLQIHNQQLKDDLDKKSEELKELKESAGKYEEMQNELDTLRESDKKLQEVTKELTALKKSSKNVQEATKELEDLRKSNKRYEENNRRLDAELVRIRNKLESI